MLVGRINKDTNSNSLQFKGLRQNLRVGDEVLREFNREFGRLKSSSFIKAKMDYHSDNPLYDSVLPKLKPVYRKYSKMIEGIRSLPVFYSIPSQDPKGFVKKIISVVKQYKYANCSVRSWIVQDKLLEKGKTAHCLSMTVKNKDGKVLEDLGHEFVVFGLKEKAKLTNPKTWGTNAVIVDPWTGNPFDAKEGLKAITEFLKIDSSKHEVNFESGSFLRR